MERSMSLRRARSTRIGRSNSSTLVRSEYASSKCAKVMRYERLSLSMRLSSEKIELDGVHRQQQRLYDHDGQEEDARTKSRARRLFDKMFSRKKIDGYVEMKEDKSAAEDARHEKISKKNKKNSKDKQSSWRPDPHKRWPVQGW